jgi:signal transduction histidine kinase/ActR/RegA family two-component response regulator
MSIDIRQLKAEPHTELGELLQRDVNILIDRWFEQAKDEISDAKHVHRDTLLDQLPRFVKAIGTALSKGGSHLKASYREPALEHGEQRWNNKWSLAALVADYQLLQLVILEYLEESLRRPLQYREIMAITVHIDEAIAASIGRYVEARDEHVRRIDHERLEALKKIDRRKDEFIATLAHELRNSLAPIVSSINLLQLSLKNIEPNVTEPIDILERQAKQVTCLVDDLFDLARISQGRFQLRKKHLDLAGILTEAICASNHLFKARDLRLDVNLPNEPLYVNADPARLMQIIVNLLSNAAKYTPRRGQIWLSAEQDRDHVVVKVRDNGVGIPPEMVSRVFDMFVQGDETSRDGQAGLGIGLTLVQRLTELHGGTVTCYSSGLGEGSEFVVRLEVSTDPIEAPAGESPVNPVASTPCRVLIIEDQVDTSKTMAVLLTMLGHEVEVANNGTTGIEQSRQFEPQVVLIDIGLPDLSGYEVAKQIREVFADNVFLVALTGYGQEDDLRAALDAGFDAHMVKPADINELNRLLSRIASDSE